MNTGHIRFSNKLQNLLEFSLVAQVATSGTGKNIARGTTDPGY